MGLLSGYEAGGIVASDFETPGSFGCYAVIFAGETDVGRFESFFEIGPYRCHQHEEAVFIGGFHSHSGCHADFEGADVE